MCRAVLYAPLGIVILVIALRVFGATGWGVFWALLCLLFMQFSIETQYAVQWVCLLWRLVVGGCEKEDTSRIL